MALAHALAMTRAPATAKLNLALVVGPSATTASTSWRRCYQRLDLVDRIAVAACAAPDVLPAFRRHARSARRSQGWRQPQAFAPALGGAADEADPGRSRPRGRQLRCRDRAPPRERDASTSRSLAERAARACGEARGRRAVLPHPGTPARRRRRHAADAARSSPGLLGRPRASTRRKQAIERRGLRSVRRARKARRVTVPGAPRSSARSGRRGGRVISPGCRRTTSRAHLWPPTCWPRGLSGRRHRRGPGRLRPLPTPRRRPRGPGRLQGPRPYLAHRPRLVRLMPMEYDRSLGAGRPSSTGRAGSDAGCARAGSGSLSGSPSPKES